MSLLKNLSTKATDIFRKIYGGPEAHKHNGTGAYQSGNEVVLRGLVDFTTNTTPRGMEVSMKVYQSESTHCLFSYAPETGDSLEQSVVAHMPLRVIDCVTGETRYTRTGRRRGPECETRFYDVDGALLDARKWKNGIDISYTPGKESDVAAALRKFQPA
jgi:hypothetical protein